MQKTLPWFLALLIASFAGQAFALESLSQNEFTTAESLDGGMTQTGVFLTAGNNYSSYYPAFRYGLGSLFEVGAKVGAITMNVSAPFSVATTSKLSLLAGADLKYQFIKQTDEIPVDLAVDLGFDATFISGKHVSELTFATIASRGFPLTDAGYKLTPYGGIELSSLSSTSIYVKEDTNYYAFAGVEWRISQKFMLTAEIKAGRTALGGLGIKFEY